MKRLAIALILVLFMCTTAFAASFEKGTDLVNSWHEYQKNDSGKESDSVQRVFYAGYVTGMADAFNGMLFDIPTGVTVAQIYTIVGKYLDDNPSQWNLDAHVLVIKSLKKAFPKR